MENLTWTTSALWSLHICQRRVTVCLSFDYLTLFIYAQTSFSSYNSTFVNFSAIFFVYQENANPIAHCQISVAFLEEASLLITQESITEAEDERKGLFMLWIYFI